MYDEFPLERMLLSSPKIAIQSKSKRDKSKTIKANSDVHAKNPQIFQCRPQGNFQNDQKISMSNLKLFF